MATLQRKTSRVRAASLLAVLLAACEAQQPATDAEVIVIGAGIAGISAALEAESQGVRVLVVEMNSVPGGHAVKAGGFALIDTPLQRARGFRDSPEIAYRDLIAWGEDADPGWVRFYAEQARVQVHDWLAGMGVKFAMVLDTPEDTVPRFHFTRGAAVNAIVPMLREAHRRAHIGFAWNTEATEIVREESGIAGVRTRNTRNGTTRLYRAPAVIIATGGFESDLALVRRSWTTSLPPPDRLLIGSGEYARGSGLQLASTLGARLTRLDHQVIFANGLPDPRDPAGERGLLTQNPAAIWVDATGRRFTNEAAATKVTDRAVLRSTPATHWLIFDAVGVKPLTIRGAAWLSATTIKKEIMENPVLVKRGDSIADLAAAAGLPVDALADTIARYNRFIERGIDTDFGRIAPGTGPAPQQIRTPPFYAIQLYPMTRKSMGGLAIDREARVLDTEGKAIDGLFACGEVTGVAGINGSFGGSGTFLGPSVLIGRVAGRSAVASLPDLGRRDEAQSSPSTPAAQPALPPDADSLATMIAQKRAGYWHFGVSHALVLERKEQCASCHKGAWPPGPAASSEQRLVQLDACTRCH
jgi:predicted oxidoreductase